MPQTEVGQKVHILRAESNQTMISRNGADVPDFVILGAPKCGTTSICETLSTHPNVFISPIKEPHYFAVDHGPGRAIQTIEEYRRLFLRAGPAQLRGEASTGYLSSERAVPELLSHRPDGKFIAIVRNPVDLFISLHNELIKIAAEDEPSLEQAWRLQAIRGRGDRIPRLCRVPTDLQYERGCSLGKQIARLYNLVPPSQRLVLIFDDLVGKPAEAYAQILDFLGVPQYDQLVIKHSNRFDVPRSRRFARGLMRLQQLPPRGFVNTVRPWLHDRNIHPFTWMRRWNLKVVKKRAISPDFRNELLEVFSDDTKLLELTLGRQLPAWRR
jgi:hypothetical protein